MVRLGAKSSLRGPAWGPRHAVRTDNLPEKVPLSIVTQLGAGEAEQQLKHCTDRLTDYTERVFAALHQM
jgi:hypothetical protein